MGSDSVWFGDGHEGSLDITRAGCKGIAGLSIGPFSLSMGTVGFRQSVFVLASCSDIS
jgi:hypothetical protein